jgi:hypothetical protein
MVELFPKSLPRDIEAKILFLACTSSLYDKRWYSEFRSELQLNSYRKSGGEKALSFCIRSLGDFMLNLWALNFTPEMFDEPTMKVADNDVCYGFHSRGAPMRLGSDLFVRQTKWSGVLDLSMKANGLRRASRNLQVQYKHWDESPHWTVSFDGGKTCLCPSWTFRN